MNANSEAVLKRAFTQARIERFNSIPDDANISWIPTQEFEKSMDKLIRKQKHFSWKFVNTTRRKVATVALIFALLFGSAMSVQAIRDPIIHFFITIAEEFTNFFSPSDSKQEMEHIEEVYNLTSLPDGYHLKVDDHLDTVITRMWSDDKNNTIGFIQGTHGADIRINTEGVGYTEIDVNGHLGYLCINEGITTVLWSDENYEFMLNCPESIDYKELLENIQKEN